MEQRKNCWWATRLGDRWLVKSPWQDGNGGRTRYVFELPLSDAATHIEAIEHMRAVATAAMLLGCSIGQVADQPGLELQTGWIEELL